MVRSVRRICWKIARLNLPLAALYYVILHYGAGLTARPSIVVALLFTGLAHGIGGSARKPSFRLRPYRVHIRPDLDRILDEFHLIRTPEDWNQVHDGIERTPASLAYIWRYGIGFTVLSQLDGERTFIYSNNHNSFVSEVRFREVLNPFHGGSFERLPGLLDNETASVFIRPGNGIDGYDLGITVPSRWWEAMKESCPKPDREYRTTGPIIDPLDATGDVDLILATVPSREFDVYSEEVARNDGWYDATMKKIADRDEDRKRLGWEVQEPPVWLSENMRDTIKHRYFLVEHRAI